MKKNWFRYLTLLVFIITGVLPSRPGNSLAYQAGTSSCGEPERSMGTLVFDQCLRQIFNYNGTEKKAIVYFTFTNGTATDRLPNVDTNPADGVNDIAAGIAQATVEAWRKYLDYGFGDPMDRNDFDIYLFDHPSLAGWCCGPRHYEFDAPIAVIDFSPGNDPKDGAAIAFHEMWHATQFSGKGGWIDEGSASNMTDHVNLALDLDNASEYLARVGGYLSGGSRQSLTTHAYDAALWWTYYLEQAGTTTTEPERGIDAMLQFWQNLGTDGLTTMDNILSGLPGGRSLESTWIDFTVANYAHKLTGPGVPAKYKYQDELQTGAPAYSDVLLDLNRALGVGDGIIATADIQSWAARYYQIRPDPAVPILNIEFRQDTNRRLGYTLLLIRGDDIVQEIRQVGRDFVRTLANNSYDRAVIIVSGLSDYANYRYSINGDEPVLNIIEPLVGRKAQAGDPLAPDKILVKVEVLSPSGGGLPVAGIDPTAFTITIGSQVVPTSQYISTAYIQGQYWILLRAPTQPASGTYNLRVDFGPTLTDTEVLAVNYAVHINADNTIIIDRSGSMASSSKMQAAKDAGRLYVDSWRTGDKVGIVSFNEAATVDLTLRDWNTTSRNDAIGTINGLTAVGNTSIGDGLVKGLNELIARGDATHDWVMVVLSDGIENRPPFIQDFMNTYTTRRTSGDKVPRVYTIALGPDADRARLERLARDTGGTYQYAGEPASAMFAVASATAAEDLPNDLAEIYRVIGETVARQQQIYSARSVLPDEKTVTHKIAVEGGASEAIFVLNWTDLQLADFSAQLIRPDNTVVAAPTLTDGSHLVWRVPTPMAGDWLLSVSREIIGPSIGLAGDAQLLVEAALKSDLTMDAFLGLAVENRLIGRPMPILVSLSDSQAILGATVRAQILTPDGSLRNMTLHDDGLHGDGNSNDGFYGNTFYATSQEGSYITILTAQGTSPLAGNFTRRLRLSFNMDAAPDTDQDGIPDWADTNPNRADGTEDPDQDGVNNLDEYKLGTDPLNPDTDNGGESDGSETSQGTDPLDPGDDQIQCMLDFQATNVLQERDDLINPEASVLLFSVDPSHDHFIIWRATDPNGPWQLLDDQVPPTGQYIDQQVTLGVTYYYRIQAVDKDGRTSCILGPRSTTPKADSIPPEGLVLINNGAELTHTQDVVLNLEASSDTVEMLVSNSPDFADASWEPYQTTKPWLLAQSLGQAIVFAKFRDADGNESDMLLDFIEVKPEANLSASKTSSPGSVQLGGNLTYTIEVTNHGPSPASGVTLTDPLPVGVTFVSVLASQGSCTEASGSVTCDLGDLANGASAKVTIDVIVDSSFPMGTIVNTASVTGSESDPVGTNNMASTETQIVTLCGLLDDFNRSDGPLGSNWNARPGRYRIVDEQASVRAGGPIYWQPDTFGPDQEACVTLTRINPKNRQHGLLLKVQEPNNWRKGAILVSYNARSGNVDVKARNVSQRKWDLVGSFTPPTPVVDGDRLRAQAWTDGTVEVFINDISIGTADAGSFYAGKGGQIGIWFRPAAGNGDDDDDDDDDRDTLALEKEGSDDDDDRSAARRARLDDFGGGSIKAPAAISCLDLQAITPFPQTFPGPTFTQAPLDFTNPVDVTGAPMPLDLADRPDDLDGRPELFIGFSSDVGGFKPFLIEFPAASFPAGVQEVWVELRQRARATILALDGTGTPVSTATQPTQHIRAFLALPGPGISRLQFDAAETLLYRICWVP